MRSREAIWNPHAPDNMCVRQRMLRDGSGSADDFEKMQRKLRSLIRKRKEMEREGTLRQPTEEERAAFAVEYEAIVGSEKPDAV